MHQRSGDLACWKVLSVNINNGKDGCLLDIFSWEPETVMTRTRDMRRTKDTSIQARGMSQ